jgi:hypothetical protein
MNHIPFIYELNKEIVYDACQKGKSHHLDLSQIYKCFI